MGVVVLVAAAEEVAAVSVGDKFGAVAFGDVASPAFAAVTFVAVAAFVAGSVPESALIFPLLWCFERFLGLLGQIQQFFVQTREQTQRLH
mmetsp:Transcript_4090/g.5146  ORF Transcript_4090/g.5146 Transcript_4090/m.5146 type:complete len:90 (-) Transcript_4090:335-604(-)